MSDDLGPAREWIRDPGRLPTDPQVASLRAAIERAEQVDGMEWLLDLARRERDALRARCEAAEARLLVKHDYGPASQAEQDAAWELYAKAHGWDPTRHPSAKSMFCGGYVFGDAFSASEEHVGKIRVSLDRAREALRAIKNTNDCPYGKDTGPADCEEAHPTARPLLWCARCLARAALDEIEKGKPPQSIAGIAPDFTDGQDSAEWLRERWDGDAASRGEGGEG